MMDQEFQKIRTLDDARIFAHRYIAAIDGLTPPPDMVLRIRDEYLDVLAALAVENPDVENLTRVASRHLSLDNLRPLYAARQLFFSPMTFVGGLYFRIIYKMQEGYTVKQCPNCGVYFMEKRRRFCSPRCQTAYNTRMSRARKVEADNPPTRIIGR